MTNPKSGKPKKIAPEVKAQLEPRYETLRLLREAYQLPDSERPQLTKRPQLTGWPQTPIHPELRNASIEIAFWLGNDALHERDDLRRLLALLDPIVRRDLEIQSAQTSPDRENPGGRPSTLPEGWEDVLKRMRNDHPAWPLKRLDYEAALVFRALPATVTKARQAAARKAKREK